MKGADEVLFKEYELIFEDLQEGRDITNTKKVFLQSPKNLQVTAGAVGTGVYAYRVSALNSIGESLAAQEVIVTEAEAPGTSSISITWDAVTGASSYKVYGRGVKDHKLLITQVGTSYSDTGAAFEDDTKTPLRIPTAVSHYLFEIPDDRLFMSVPKLIEKSTGTEFTEGTEYTIKALRKININAEDVTQKTDLTRRVKFNKYLSKSSLVLSPILNKFYFSIFGKEDPAQLIVNSKYLPHLKDYGSKTYHEKRELYAQHLKFWSWGYSSKLRNKPTLSNIQKAYGLAQDYPFSYIDGTAVVVSGEYITVSGEEGMYTYDIGSGNNHLFSQGEQVTRFDLLCSGITATDYYTDSVLIEGLVQEDEEERLVLNLNKGVTFNEDTDIVAQFKKIAIPAGIVLKETTN